MADTLGIYSIRDGIIHPNAMEWNIWTVDHWSLVDHKFACEHRHHYWIWICIVGRAPCSGGQKVVLGLMKIRGRSSSPIRLTSFTRVPAAANTRSSSSWEPIRGEHRGSANHSSPRWGRRCLCAPPPAAAPCGCAWARAGRRGSGGCRRGWGGRRPRWGRGPCAGPTLRLKVGKYYF